jgi:hypothetical protein
MRGVEEHRAGWSRNTPTADAVGARSNGAECDRWTTTIPQLGAIVGHADPRAFLSPGRADRVSADAVEDRFGSEAAGSVSTADEQHPSCARSVRCGPSRISRIAHHTSRTAHVLPSG